MFQMRPLYYQLLFSASPVVENMQLLLKRGRSDRENTFSHNLEHLRLVHCHKLPKTNLEFPPVSLQGSVAAIQLFY